MTIIESVRDFIAECPYLEKLLRIHVDFLPARETAYSIEEMPVQTIVAQNVDGSTRRQFSFVFAAQLAYSDEARNNIDNSGFYESFADWLERCTAGGKLPTLPQGMTAEAIEAQSCGYLFDAASDLRIARYQIQCRLLYEREAIHAGGIE